MIDFLEKRYLHLGKWAIHPRHGGFPPP